MNPTQPTFTHHRAGKTQCDRILELLQERIGQPVPMPELARVGAGSPNGFCMVHSRVADLRKQGHTIGQHGERKDGVNLSFYTLRQA